MSEIAKKRINKDEIVAQADWRTQHPIVRHYSDNEQKVMTGMNSGPSDGYHNFCSFLIRSWIDGSRYAETELKDDGVYAEHMTAMMTANSASRQNYVTHHAAQGEIDVPQAVHDARQMFLSIGNAQEVSFQ